jgi:hypothetical protein
VSAPFDETPPEIVFIAPGEGSVHRGIPRVLFEIRDVLSGPDATARRLEVLNTGPSARDTTDLTGFTSIVAQDPVRGVVRVEATGVPESALRDGFLVLRASGADAAGNRGAADRGVVLDREAPRIVLTAPVPGDVVRGLETAFSATVADAVTGVSLSSVSVRLDGVDITTGVRLTAGPAGPLGAPGEVTFEGVLRVVPGSRLLEVSAGDAAGNGAEARFSFTVEGEPPEAPALALRIVSGDGQEGLVGRPVENGLVVQAVDPSTGAPVEGVLVVFEGLRNAGTFRRVDSSPTVTDRQGRVRVRYVLSPVPGDNVVAAEAAGFEDTARVEFHLRGTLPGLQDVSVIGPCNLWAGTSEYPGSALPMLFTVQATRPGGGPLAGEVVRPRVSEFRRAAPERSIGRFLPGKALTDAEGKATFAFVIDRDAPSGEFTMRFGLPEFRDAEGREVAVEIRGAVRDPAGKPRGPGDVEIDYFSDPERSGQGQVGIPGLRLALPLRAFMNGGFGGIVYRIIEGFGTFENGDGREGEIAFRDFDACGNPVVGVTTVEFGGGGIGNVRFTPGSRHVLIAMEGFTDIFAVGPPEVAVVGDDGSGGWAEVPNVVPVEAGRASDEVAFRLLARVPKGRVPAGEVRGVDSLGRALGPDPEAVGRPVLGSGELGWTFSSSESRPEFDVYVTRPVVATDERVLPGRTPSVGGGGAALLAVSPFGGVEGKVSVDGQEIRLRIRNAALSPAVGDRRGLIFDKMEVPGSATSRPSTIRFSFGLGDREALESVDWDLDGDGRFDKTIEGRSEVFAQFVDAGGNVGLEGTVNQPLLLVVPETNENRRRNIEVRARVTYKDREGKRKTVPLSTVLRLALTSRVPAGATPAPAASQEGLESVRNWRTNPPRDSSGNPIVFQDPAAPDVAPSVPPDVRQQIAGLGVNLGRNPLSFTSGDIKDAQAATFLNLRNFDVYGAAVDGGAFRWDKDVLEAVIDHEAAHARSAADAKIQETLFRKLAVRLSSLQDEFLDRYMATFEHARLLLADLKDARRSYRYLNDSNMKSNRGGPGYEAFFVQAFNAVERALVEQEDYVAKVEGHKLFRLEGLDVGEPLRAEIRAYLNGIYTEAVERSFPELGEREEFWESLQLIRPR